MKKIFSSVLILFLVYSNQVLSQSSPPDLISYQGIARDASGNILPNHLINVKFNIHQGSPNGPVVFSEPHSITTNSLGLFSLQIGSVNQNLNSVLWSNGPYYLEVLI
ncbi:MAG: Ig-like domain-containing protein, partial [Bacteroidia bacterium]|nr:Ig-like domain-containing protein [Bacteroidia bacterium]